MHLVRRSMLATTALVVGLGTMGFAQDRVTLGLRSGETVAGRFDGTNQGLFYIDVSDTDERKIPLGQIAVIDLAGGASGLPETELREARGGSHVLVTRNGGLTKGQLVKIDGARINEASVVFRADGGEERRVPMGDVARLYLGNYPGAAPATSGPATTPATGGVQSQGQTRVVTLPGTTQWIDTGVMVRQGDSIVISANGQVGFSGDANDKASPNGSLRGARTPGAPLPDTLAGALIGRVGNSAPFGVGQNATINAPATGRLFLGINDDNVSDNNGSFEIHVTPASGGGGRRRP